MISKCYTFKENATEITFCYYTTVSLFRSYAVFVVSFLRCICCFVLMLYLLFRSDVVFVVSFLCCICCFVLMLYLLFRSYVVFEIPPTVTDQCHKDKTSGSA